jgi:hypothetical protein
MSSNPNKGLEEGLAPEQPIRSEATESRSPKIAKVQNSVLGKIWSAIGNFFKGSFVQEEKREAVDTNQESSPAISAAQESKISNEITGLAEFKQIADHFFQSLSIS